MVVAEDDVLPDGEIHPQPSVVVGGTGHISLCVWQSHSVLVAASVQMVGRCRFRQLVEQISVLVHTDVDAAVEQI